MSIQIEEEAIKAEAAQASRDRLEQAQRVYKVREAMALKASENVKRIESSWNYGDETYTGADLAAAKEEVQRSKALFDAADSELTRARKGLLTENPEIARAVAEIAAKVLHVEAVKVSNVAPAFAHDLTRVPADLPLPCLYVIQRKPTDRSRGGLTGEVDLVLIRHTNHRDLDTEALATALRADRWTVDIDRPLSGESGPPEYRGRDESRLTVALGYEAVPVVSKSGAEGCCEAVGNLIGEIARAQSGRVVLTVGNDYMITGDRYTAPSIRCQSESIETDSKVSKDGIRTTTVIVDVFGWSEHPAVTLTIGEVGEFITRAVPLAVGCAVPSGGRITEAKVLHTSPVALDDPNGFYDRKAIAVRVKVGLTSKDAAAQ